MSALTLFDLEPAVERGVHGTVAVCRLPSAVGR